MNIAPDVLLDQYQRARRLWPVIADIEVEFNLPPYLLFAVGSRETGLASKYAEGEVHADGHGWGLFGADDRWNTLDLPHFASDPEEQARLAARSLRANFKRLGSWLDAVNAYGPEWARGTESDAYGPDVLDRAAYLAEHYGGSPPMQEWMPDVEHIDRGGGVPVQTDGPTVIVLHTTEGDNRASYSGSEPHFEIDSDGAILQYISLAHTAKALYNYPGTGVETNRRRGRIIQYELVNHASMIADITDAQLDGLAESLRWVETQLPFVKTGPPQGWFGSEAAAEDADSRFSFDDWEDYSGICGHQHVPENDHWDPGRFPLTRLLARLTSAPPPKEDELTDEQAAQLAMIARYINDQAERDANATNDARFATLNGSVDEIKARVERIEAAVTAKQ